MADIFIYSGLAIMLLGAIFGFFVALRGYRSTDWKFVRRIQPNAFSHGNTSAAQKRLQRCWAAAMAIGIAITGLGVYLATR